METYDGILTKPELNDDTLTHYGIKGMRWKKGKKTILDLSKKLYKGTKKLVTKKSRDVKNSYYHLKGQRMESNAIARRYDAKVLSPQLITNGNRVSFKEDTDFWTGRSNSRTGSQTKKKITATKLNSKNKKRR